MNMLAFESPVFSCLAVSRQCFVFGKLASSLAADGQVTGSLIPLTVGDGLYIHYLLLGAMGHFVHTLPLLIYHLYPDCNQLHMCSASHSPM